MGRRAAQLRAARSRAGAATPFTITFAGTTPATVVLHAEYTGPAVPAQALYDAGDGNWTAYTSNTITLAGSYLRFSGDWRTAAGTYQAMFKSALAGGGYTCVFSGTLEGAATASSAYYEIFRDCTSVVSIAENPFQPITGAPAAYMFSYACSGMSGVTGSLPAGFLDTSGLTGAPATYMFRYACYNMSGVTSGDIVIGAGITLTSANVVGPLSNMFSGAANWTGQLYWGSDVIHTVLTPDSDIDTFAGCTSMPDFATIDANWK